MKLSPFRLSRFKLSSITPVAVLTVAILALASVLSQKSQASMVETSRAEATAATQWLNCHFSKNSSGPEISKQKSKKIALTVNPYSPSEIIYGSVSFLTDGGYLVAIIQKNATTGVYDVSVQRQSSRHPYTSTNLVTHQQMANIMLSGAAADGGQFSCKPAANDPWYFNLNGYF